MKRGEPGCSWSRANLSVRLRLSKADFSGKSLPMVCVPLGDSAVLVELGSTVGEETALRVRALALGLARHRLEGVYDLVPSFTTLGVHFDPNVVGGADPYARVEAWVCATARESVPAEAKASREHVLPIRYGGEAGPDLPVVAERARLTEREAIARLSEALYSVGAIGFAPGFPYLLGLPVELNTPRRATPRVWVPAGSVAIGGPFAGIYPTTTPGGWNLIGRTTSRLFDLKGKPHSLLRVGDRVRFRDEASQVSVSMRTP